MAADIAAALAHLHSLGVSDLGFSFSRVLRTCSTLAEILSGVHTRSLFHDKDTMHFMSGMRIAWCGALAPSDVVRCWSHGMCTQVCHGDVYAHNVMADADGKATLLDYGAQRRRHLLTTWRLRAHATTACMVPVHSLDLKTRGHSLHRFTATRQTCCQVQAHACATSWSHQA